MAVWTKFYSIAVAALVVAPVSVLAADHSQSWNADARWESTRWEQNAQWESSARWENAAQWEQRAAWENTPSWEATRWEQNNQWEANAAWESHAQWENDARWESVRWEAESRAAEPELHANAHSLYAQGLVSFSAE